jgi:hypothetical protein
VRPALGRLRRRPARTAPTVLDAGLDRASALKALATGPQDVVVRAAGLRALAELAAATCGTTEVRLVRVVLRDLGPRGRVAGSPRWRLGALATSQVVRRPDELEVSLRMRRPTDLGVVLLDVVRVLAPIAERPSPGRREVRAATAEPWSPDWLPLVDGPLAADLVEGVLPAADVLLAPTGAPAGHDRVQVVDPAASRFVVTPWLHRPAGRSEDPRGRATVEAAEAGFALRCGPQVLAVGPRGLADEAVAALRDVAVLDVDPSARDADGLMEVLLQASASGVTVRYDGPAGTADPSVSSSWARACGLDDPGELELESVQQQRAALRHHAAGTRTLLGELPTVSVILSSHRDAALDHALAQLRKLDYPALEAVLGLHGTATGPAEVDERWRALGAPYPLTAVTLAPDLPFGAVLARVSERAQGALLTKMDDDDWYASSHIWDLVLARETSGAVVVGKAAEFVHVEARQVTVRRSGSGPYRYGRFVAGGTMMLARADLEAVGGWRPVARSVDRALLDRVHRAGGSAYRTWSWGYTYVRGAAGHTWTVDEEHFLGSPAATWPGLPRRAELGTD